MNMTNNSMSDSFKNAQNALGVLEQAVKELTEYREASPSASNLQAFVREFLDEQNFKNVEVITEW